MKNWYYFIWADAIRSVRKHHPRDKDWKGKIFILITFIHSANFWFILVWLQYFHLISIPELTIDFFGNNYLDGFFSFAVTFASPFVVLNYVLVFNKNRYESILQKYPETKYRWSAIYSFTVLAINLATVFFIGLVLKH
jgi:hypothetical protein